jgi:hypothetical protein
LIVGEGLTSGVCGDDLRHAEQRLNAGSLDHCVLAIDRRLLINGLPAIGGVITSEWAADAIGVGLTAEWLMLRADRGRLRSTRIKGLV